MFRMAFAFICGAALATAAVPMAAQGDKEEAAKKKKLIGTWERSDLPPQYKQIKTFTDTHFMWVVYQPEDGKVLAVGGGKYTFNGKTCTEKYEYGSGNIQEFVKQEPPVFTLTFEDGGYLQEGKAPNGAELREKYRKAK
jgi:phage pi2 protein 07